MPLSGRIAVLFVPHRTVPTVVASFQPPSSQSTLSGVSIRSLANLRLSQCQPLPGFGSSPASVCALLHHYVRGHAADAPPGILRRGQHRRIASPSVHPPRFLQGGERLVGQGRDVFVARLLVLCPPPDGPVLEVDVRPAEFTDGTDSVPGLMREHEGDLEPPPDLPRHLQYRPVLVPGEGRFRTCQRVSEPSDAAASGWSSAPAGAPLGSARSR